MKLKCIASRIGFDVWDFTKGKEYMLEIDEDGDSCVKGDNGIKLYVLDSDDNPNVFEGAGFECYKFKVVS